jgi:CheY-like chemotaxis protein
MSLAILLIDDDVLVSRAVGRLLKRDGHDVTAVADESSAVALVARFDVAVVDLNLQGGSGVGVAARLVQSGAARRAVFFTGETDPVALDRARAIGPVVAKDVDVLRELLRGWSEGGGDVAAERRVAPRVGR